MNETEVDDVYFDRPYYLAPADRSATGAFDLIREGLASSGVVAIAEAVVFRRVRSVLIRAYHTGLAAITLNADYEVRPASDAFADVPDLEIKSEMLKLAQHIIETKRGVFDPSAFHDRYEAALAELVRAKLEGRRIEPPKRAAPTRSSDLMAALRESAGISAKAAGERAPARVRRPVPRKKAS